MEYYYLLDSRAGMLSAANGGENVSELDEDAARYVLLAASSEEVCNAANDNSYGNDCVVSDREFNIQWDWFSEGRWQKPKLK